MISKPIEHNDPTPSPNFEFPVFEAEEDDVEEIPDEITRLLEHEEKDLGNFVIPGGICNNWVAIDVPTGIHKST